MGDKLRIIFKWQKLTSDKVILQMVRGDTIEFENDIPTKHKAKKKQFLSRGKGRKLSWKKCYIK